MRVYKTVKVDSRQLDSVTCDVCKKVFKEDTIEGDMQVSRKVTFRVETSESCRFHADCGGSSTVFEPDICHKCYENCLRPFLTDLGLDTKTTDRDW